MCVCMCVYNNSVSLNLVFLLPVIPKTNCFIHLCAKYVYSNFLSCIFLFLLPTNDHAKDKLLCTRVREMCVCNDSTLQDFDSCCRL